MLMLLFKLVSLNGLRGCYRQYMVGAPAPVWRIMAKMCDETFECQEAKKTRINSQHKFPYIAVKLIKYSVNHFVSSLFTGSFSLWEHY